MDERKLIKILKNNGYKRHTRGNGNHIHYKKQGIDRLVTINGGKETNPMIVKRLMKQIAEDNGILIK